MFKHERKYAKGVHLLHAALEHGHGLGDGLRDLLGAVRGLQLGSQCAHLDAEALQVQRLLLVSNRIFRKNLRTIHVVLVKSLIRTNKQRKQGKNV